MCLVASLRTHMYTAKFLVMRTCVKGCSYKYIYIYVYAFSQRVRAYTICLCAFVCVCICFCKQNEYNCICTDYSTLCHACVTRVSNLLPC